MPVYNVVRPFNSLFLALGPVQYSVRTVYTSYPKKHTLARVFDLLGVVHRLYLWVKKPYVSEQICFPYSALIAEIIQDHWITYIHEYLPNCFGNAWQFCTLYSFSVRRDEIRKDQQKGPFLYTCIFQGLTKRCRLSWLTNSAHVRVQYMSPNAASPQPMSTGKLRVKLVAEIVPVYRVTAGA